MQRVSNNSEMLVNTIAWFNTYSWCIICQKNNNNRKKRQQKLGRFVWIATIALLSPNWLHKRNFCFVILWLIKSKQFHFYPSIFFQPLILLRNICMHILCLDMLTVLVKTGFPSQLGGLWLEMLSHVSSCFLLFYTAHGFLVLSCFWWLLFILF